MLEAAHLGSGSGSVLREDDRRGVNCLCSLLHRLHVADSAKVPTMNFNGKVYPTIDNANMIWLKQKFDPEYYDPDYIARIWACKPPEPEPLHRHWLSELRDNIGMSLG